MKQSKLYKGLIPSLLFLISTSFAESQPKNIILMISDGCGYNQILSTNYFQYGKAKAQAYENFPVQLAMSSWSTDANVFDSEASQDASWVLLRPTDSGASATAYATGFKTYNGAIGVDSLWRRLTNLSEIAHSKQKSTGVVTTVPLSHATPAAFVAHHKSRKNYEEIAKNMVYESSLDLIIGAGHPDYDNDGIFTEEKEFKFVGGESTWSELKSGKAKNLEGPWVLLQDKSEFEKILKTEKLPERIFGVLEVRETLQEKRSGAKDTQVPYEVPFNKNLPDLSLLSKVALKQLSQNKNGFFLMIEGGAIDWAGHDNLIARAIEEEIDFNLAVDTVIKWIENNGGWEENLLVIGADHETGYLSGPEGLQDSTIDYLPQNKGKGNLPSVKWNTKHHSNQLVPLFAKGRGAEKLNDYIAGHDKHRGDYTDNALVGQFLQNLILGQ